MGMHISVRKAEERDLDWISSQLREFSLFFNSKLPLFGDEAYVRIQLAGMLGAHVLLVSENEQGHLTGMVGGLLSPHPFNPEIRVLGEIFWWVAQKFRGTRSGLVLLNEFVEIGKKSADWVTFSLEDISPVNERTLMRRGFRLKERSFYMEVA